MTHLRAGYPLSVILLAAAAAAAAGVNLPAKAPSRPPTQISSPTRTFQVTARKYAFAPTRLEVAEGDLVRIELHTDDIAHSLTIDGYRLSRRVDSGHPSVLEFRADRAGTYPFYCNLQIDDGCRKMRGELVVSRKR